MRLLVMLALASALTAAEAPLPDVPDPYGLGRRLALIDLLRDEFGLQIDAGVAEEDLDKLYRRELAKRAAPPPAPEPVLAAPARPAAAAAATPAAAPAIVATPPAPDGAAPVRERAIGIPGEGWSLTIADLGWGPIVPRQTAQGVTAEAATGDGLILSFFVEPAAGAGRSHEDVRDHYWRLAARNPLIDPATVTIERDARFVAVRYATAGIPQANFYFCWRDRWVDVHVSDTRAQPDATFADFARHLSYRPGEAAAAAVAAARPAAPAAGAAAQPSVTVAGTAVTWSAPDAWQVDTRQNGPGGAASLRFVTAGAVLQVTVIADPPGSALASEEGMKAAVAQATLPYVAISVEGKADLVPLIGATGSGFCATFTDRSLVGVPPVKGKYLMLTTGMYRAGPVIGAFTLVFDRPDSPLAAAGLDIVRSLTPVAAPAGR